jgi:phage FluMu protein Com
MEIVDAGPIWICYGCHAMVRGTPTEEEIRCDEIFGNPEWLDIGYHCPNCKVWNVSYTREHPFVIDKKKRMEEKNEKIRKQQANLDLEINSAKLAMLNKRRMKQLLEEQANIDIRSAGEIYKKS